MQPLILSKRSRNKNPSQFLDRMRCGFTVLLKQTPTLKMIKAYYTTDCTKLQQFCLENGPKWCTKISLIAAAEVLAEGMVNSTSQSKQAFLDKEKLND